MAEVVASHLAEQLVRLAQLKVIGKGVEEDVDKLSKTLDMVRAMLFDADQRQFVDEPWKLWVAKVHDFCYEADAVLDKWRTAMLKSRIDKGEIGDPGVALLSKKVVFSIASSSFVLTQFRRVVLRRDIAIKIMELNQKLVEITSEKESYLERRIMEEEARMTTFSTPVLDGPEIFGRDGEKKVLLDKLLSQGSKYGGSLEIIPIVGMGGIGKTALAQLAYNDDAVRYHFDQTYWVHVGDPFDLIRIAKAITKAITGSVPELVELESLLTRISGFIQGKRFLLVLDEVWTEDWMKWEPLEGSLKHGALGSRILVTTRKKKVAVMMRSTSHMICLESLSDEASWSIFKRVAFLEGEGEEGDQFEEIGREIVKKCGGVPLAVKALGLLLHDKYSEEEWKKVLHDQLWELGDVKHTVLSPLLLSYYDLSPLEKRCLLYCSLFPTDFEILKDDLIELWMSQGYLDGNKSYERGEIFYKSLVMRSIIQNLDNNFYGEYKECRIKGVIRESLRFIARNKCFNWRSFSSGERTYQEGEIIHHYTLLLNSGAQIPISLYQNKKLRTLFVMRSEISTPLNLNLLPKLACLRTLCLRDCGVEELPRGIDKLIHLRYLNLSDNRNLKELPKELCNLLNLQTLRLNECAELRSLPKQMGKLVNLRHLYIEGCYLKELPKGIGRLTSLRILDEFFVPFDYLRKNKAMRLVDLNMLEHLQGFLCVRGIGNIEDAGDVEKAKLRNKQSLTDLKLNFSQDTEPHKTDHELEVLLDAFQPPPNLKYLQISTYNGATFPNWMVSLVNLRCLILFSCANCEFLPPLGRLPSLEILHMFHMDKVEKVGLEFLGVETGSNTTERESSSVSFPKLKELRFEGLSNWKQWLGIGNLMNPSKIMPSLRLLEILDCQSLETLPDFLPAMPVQELEIDNCPILEQRCRKEVGEDWHLVSHIPNIGID